MSSTENGGQGSKGFAGMWQILRYNWHFYAATLALDLAVAILMRFPPPARIRLVLWVGAGVATFWSVSSLLVSHYVYDRSQLAQWNWLTGVLKGSPEHWANIHAGLDQTSEPLMRLFPDARPRVLDIYVSSQMSEPSIRRARYAAKPAIAPESASPFALPLKGGECDAIFLIFVAHELRKRDSRLTFFREVFRALKPSGSAVLVEHMRDWRNLLAYGPGVLHFFPRGDWLLIAGQAELNLTHESAVTPFVRCFIFSKPSSGFAENSPQPGNVPCD